MESSFSCCRVTCCRKHHRLLDASISQKRIGEVYDRIAPVYDLWGKLTESRARNRALELANIQDGQHILEVAVGTGLAFYEIVKRNPTGSNMGIDLSAGMLEKARRRLRSLSGTNYSLAAGTAFDLKVEDESIDLLVNNYMFDLIAFDDMDDIIHEFRRVLKNNGRLVLVNMTQGERFGSGLYETIYRISPASMGGCRGVKMAEKLQLAGFHVEVREYVQQMLFPSEVLLARK
ncbi:MAG: ubiquinone biosynthesis protein UbiE [Deltaproteobacteria bacterium SG8_13]|nr:MAG: ubiquinone biosynthesis protein UbiE [Deltaproteobacteria bacterium SG8_13]